MHIYTSYIFPKGWEESKDKDIEILFSGEKKQKPEPLELVTWLGTEIVFGEPALFSVTLNLS